MKRRVMVMAMVMALAAGCGGDDGQDGRGAGDVAQGEPDVGPGDTSDPGPGDPDIGDPDIGDPGSGDPGSGDPDSGDPDVGEPDPNDPYSGVWAQLSVQSALADVPIVGEVTMRTVAVQRVVIGRGDGGYVMRATTCSVEMESSAQIVSTVIPDAFVRSLGESQRPLTLSEEGGTHRLESPRMWEARGVNLANLETDPLPTDESDPRIFDQDGDGKPGMTVRVTGIIDGEIYLVQRNWSELSGQSDRADRLDGLVRWGDEQSILGADPALLASNQPDSRPDPEPANSYFRMTKLSTPLDCAQIEAQADALFAR